jgi:hypothetical protein
MRCLQSGGKTYMFYCDSNYLTYITSRRPSLLVFAVAACSAMDDFAHAYDNGVISRYYFSHHWKGLSHYKDWHMLVLEGYVDSHTLEGLPTSSDKRKEEMLLQHGRIPQ